MISLLLQTLKTLQIKQLTCYLMELFDELYIYYSHYVNAIKYDVTEKKVLPFTDIGLQCENDSYEFDPSAEEILKYYYLNMQKA